MRWADGDVHPVDGRVAVVRETHPVGGAAPSTWSTRSSCSTPTAAQDVVVSGPDFVSDPRWSPDGDSLAWLEWDHPAMPWDSSTLKVQNDMGVVTVAGGVDEAAEGICQPQWAPDGSLWFCSDRDDWWSLYRWTPESGVEQVFGEPGEVGAPQWVFGLSRYAFLDGRPGRARGHARGPRLAAPARARRQVVDASRIGAPRSRPRGLRRHGRADRFLAGRGARCPAVRGHRPSASPAPVETLSAVRDLGIDPEWFSEPEHIEFPGGDGRPTYANFYRPTNPTAAPLDGELPPLIVTIHGGPTSNAVSTLSLAMQFWTTRGFAVVDVDYGGSTGYGRAYRDRLQGEWGLLDVGDCVAVVRWLGEQGWVDPAAGGDPRRVGQRLHRADGAGDLGRLRRRRRLLRRGRRRGAGAGDPQVRVALPRRADRAVPRGPRRLQRAVAADATWTRSPRPSSCSRATRTRWCRRRSPRRSSPPSARRGCPSPTGCTPGSSTGSAGRRTSRTRWRRSSRSTPRCSGSSSPRTRRSPSSRSRTGLTR